MSTKTFDCVQMKWDIQRRLIERFKNMPRDRIRDQKRKMIQEDPVLGPFLEKVREASQKRTKE